jgi:exodeoxyribonuclease VII small subunit
MTAKPLTPAEAPRGAEAELSFEQALERLESIVDQLESGQLTLEQSLTFYEEGVRLSRQLTLRLDEAEKRIERLREGEAPRHDPTSFEVELKPADRSSGEGELPF